MDVRFLDLQFFYNTIVHTLDIGIYIDRLTPMPRTLFRKDGFCLKEGDAAHIQ